MSKQVKATQFELSPADNNRLASLCGQFDNHLRQIERRLGVEINNRGHLFTIIGEITHSQDAAQVLQQLYQETESMSQLTPEHVHLALQQVGSSQPSQHESYDNHFEALRVKTKRGYIKPRGLSQQNYIHNILKSDISFGVGPAGTGKTYLAVACAVEALERDEVRRILLTRPAVEAGERLGFLPGDLTQKIDPYLRPLYDALYEMLGFERIAKLIERNVIEIAPLAYMRGRTLNDAFIILDESQNTTTEQMKMFLTRIGFNSKAVITGDITQVDLPRGQKSGLRHVIEVIGEDVEGISFTFFQSQDVVRHPVVQRVVQAYEQFERKHHSQQ